MNSGKILYGLKIFSASDRITGKEGCQPEEQDGTGHKGNMACHFRDKIRKKTLFTLYWFSDTSGAGSSAPQ